MLVDVAMVRGVILADELLVIAHIASVTKEARFLIFFFFFALHGGYCPVLGVFMEHLHK